MTHRAIAGLVFCLPALGGCAAPSSTDGESLAAEAGLELTLENIHMGTTGARGVALSPNGQHLVISGASRQGNGLYLSTRDEAVAGQLGREPGSLGGYSDPGLWLSGPTPTWSAQSDRIVFARGGEIWVADLEGGAEAITPEMEGARSPVFSPDGERVAFYATPSGHQDLWLVPSDGSVEPRPLTDAAMALDDPRFEPAWSPDGATVAYVSNASDYWHDDIWLIEASTGARRQLTTGLMAMSTPVWSPDGSRIAVFGTSKDEYWYEDLAYIYVIDVASGDERIVDMQVYASDAAMRHKPAWSEDGETIYFPYIERGSGNLWAVPADGGVATRVTNLEGSLSSYSAAGEGDALAFIHSSPTHGGEAFVLRGGGGAPAQVTEFSRTWAGVEAPREVSFRTFDGLYIQGFLYLPPHVASARDRSARSVTRGVGNAALGSAIGPSCPALVQVHGGGTNTYQNGLNLTEQYLASRGFVVLAINYRGGSGFGREFQDLSVEDWLYDQALDAGAAADYLRGLPYVNGKVGIYGGSYGGSMSLSAVSLTPDKFDAAVPMRGAYSKLNTLEYTDRLGKIFSVTGHGGTPEERPDTYAKSNVVSRIGNITAPVLLMHGELDRRVPIQNFENAVAEFERLGKEHEVKTYPTEAHGFRGPENRIDMYSRLEGFFARHLGVCEN